MSEWTQEDLSMTLAGGTSANSALVVQKFWASNPTKLVWGYGYSPEGCASWQGGFVFECADGSYVKLSGWCDTTGWGCQDEVTVMFAAGLNSILTEGVGKWTKPSPEDEKVFEALRKTNEALAS